MMIGLKVIFPHIEPLGPPDERRTIRRARFWGWLDADRSVVAKDRAESSRAGWRLLLLPILASAIAALAGGAVAVQLLMPPREAVTLTAPGLMGTADGLWFTVQSAVWDGQDPKMEQAGPTSLGTNSKDRPHGLRVEIKVQNRGDQIRMLGSGDFQLRDTSGGIWVPTGRTLPETSLEPRQYLHTVLAFDVPETTSRLELIWSRSGQEMRVSVGEPSRGRADAEPMGGEVSSCLPTVAVRCGGLSAYNQTGRTRRPGTQGGFER